MKENRRREILIFAVVLSVSLIAVLLINTNKPFAIFGSDGQAKQVTNAFWDQQATQATPNPNETTTLSPDTSLSAELQLTNTNQTSDSKTATYSPSGTQSPSVTTSGTASASSGTANILPLSATSTPANRPTQTNQPGSAPTATRQPTNTALPRPTQTTQPGNTPTVTKKPANTITPSPTPTSSLQTGWAGEWIIYLEKANGTYRSGIVYLDKDGNKITGSATIEGQQYSIDGFIFEENKAEGFLTTQNSTTYFKRTKLSSNQFGGSSDDIYGLCGNRQSGGKPEPCKSLPGC